MRRRLKAGFDNNVQCGATTLNNFAISVRREVACCVPSEYLSSSVHASSVRDVFSVAADARLRPGRHPGQTGQKQDDGRTTDAGGPGVMG